MYAVLILLAGHALGFAQDGAPREGRTSPANARACVDDAAGTIPVSPRGGMLVRARAEGVDFVPLARTSAGDPGWNFGLSFTGLRRGELTVAAGRAQLQRGEGYVAYVHDAIVQWYVDDEAGLEQVFTIQEPPLSEDSAQQREPLELQLELRGDLCLDVHPDDRNATLTDACGRPALSYSGLRAWDAEGGELAARLGATNGGLTIYIDDVGAQYPITVDPLIGCLRARLAPPDLVDLSLFGYSMAVDGTSLVVSAVDAGAPSPCGAVYVFRNTGSKWVREAKLVSSSNQPDGFGADVAIDGNTVVVGASDSNDLGARSGSAFVFVRSGNQWSQQARLLAGDGAAYDYFGNSVAVRQDRAVIGAWQDDEVGSDSGSAYVFERSGAVWTQTAKLVPSNGQQWAEFGASVDLDESMIVVGAPFHAQFAGAGYVFRNSAGAWVQEATLWSSAGLGAFGWSVSTSNGRVLCGERGSVSSAGAAHWFRRVGGIWSPECSLSPLDSVVGDGFGTDVDLLAGRALVGAPGAPPFGAAYVFDLSAGAWSQGAKLLPLTSSWIAELGSSVALGGGVSCAGDPFDSQTGNLSGAAYVYELVEDHSTYCTAKVNSLGCTPTIAAQGSGSAHAAQGLFVTCSLVRNQTLGLLLYSTGGRSSTPFQGGLLCMNAPIRRTPGRSSGGSAAPAVDCSGAFSIDMNAFARGLLGGQPIPELGAIGTVVQCQWWGRDSGFAPPFDTMLSDALEYTVVQ